MTATAITSVISVIRSPAISMQPPVDRYNLARSVRLSSSGSASEVLYAVVPSHVLGTHIDISCCTISSWANCSLYNSCRRKEEMQKAQLVASCFASAPVNRRAWGLLFCLVGVCSTIADKQTATWHCARLSEAAGYDARHSAGCSIYSVMTLSLEGAILKSSLLQEVVGGRQCSGKTRPHNCYHKP